MHLDKYLLVLSAVIICASCSHSLDQEWEAWKTKHGKHYVTSHDESFRRMAWEATWHKVQEHNQKFEQRLTKYRMGMNKFADMTSRERRSRSCLSPKGKRGIMPTNFPVRAYSKSVDTPESVDWRDSKCVTHVKNQGLCGSCWAFATVGVVEARNCIKTSELVELSEQQLVDCDNTNDGCCGGDPAHAMDYVTRNGMMKATDYEYADKQAACFYKPANSLTFNVSKYYNMFGEDNMATSVALDGPIAVSLDASEDFQLYEHGVFLGECSEELNHAVIIVGYGTEYVEEEEENVDYWIVKNSWGDDWGDNGYIKMKRNVNLCGIGSEAAAVDLV
ncbi:PREDICTED: zingipain-2-like [Nanorana parkeri]|uniref:zingipain-2-like n=1 Tax=Nanorana parkeri TaxID=125878 RepID=UPI0008540B58|nr:PREDICTED: zingipain-2-like [Nanorana parkeri]